jgi:phospholipase C
MGRRLFTAFVGPLLVATALSACSKGGFSGSPLPSAPSLGSANGKITHIVFVVQENRTFDNLFGGPNPYPGADAATNGVKTDGSTVALHQVELECTYYDVNDCSKQDPDNFHADFLTACNAPAGTGPPFAVGLPSPCRMNGFDQLDPILVFDPYLPYSYVDYSETKPYWDMARAYALGDRFFMSHNSESYIAHQYIFSGQSNNVVDEPKFTYTPSNLDVFVTPWGCDSPPGTTTFYLNPQTGTETPSPLAPCFGYKSLADLVNAAGLSWRLYAYSLCQNINALDVNISIRYDAALWPQNQSSCPNYDSVNTAHFRMHETKFLSDVASGDLANVTWVLPGPSTSDHPGVPAGYCGPWWVASIVDAIGNSKFWDSTAIFVFWDDWGGFYDHVPPYVVRDQAGPGPRVPLLVISPYAKRNYVSHTNAEFGTLLKFTENTFGLGSLGATDASPYINNLDDFFDWNKKQTFTSIQLPDYAYCNLPSADSHRVSPSSSRWLKMIRDGDD